jgi:Recombination endonuclease VII
METKVCSRCGLEKELSSFSKRTLKSGKVIKQAYCKDCNKAHKNAWLPEHRENVKWNTMWTKYRLRKSDWEKMLLGQGNLCKLCLKVPPVHVDHNHETGEVRGLLCAGCNLTVGLLETEPARMQNIKEYLSH